MRTDSSNDSALQESTACVNGVPFSPSLSPPQPPRQAACRSLPPAFLLERRPCPPPFPRGCLATRLDCGDGGACPLCWLSTHPPGRKPLALPAADNSAAVALSHGAARRR